MSYNQEMIQELLQSLSILEEFHEPPETIAEQFAAWLIQVALALELANMQDELKIWDQTMAHVRFSPDESSFPVQMRSAKAILLGILGKFSGGKPPEDCTTPMNLKLYVFISYQTDDKLVAGRIRNILSGVGVESFLAHEDVDVSKEWRVRILEEIGKADIFISLLSKSYSASPWCVQESGIAAFRKDMTVIPLSIDGSKPQGFVRNIQSLKINPDQVTMKELLPGFLEHNSAKGIDLTIEIIGRSGSFRVAEANFRIILPYLGDLSDEQMKRLLEKIVANKQIHHANMCARDYIPPLLEDHGHLLDEADLRLLEEACAQYA